MLIVTRTAEVLIRACMPHSNGTCQSCVMRFKLTDSQTGLLALLKYCSWQCLCFCCPYFTN